MLTNQQIQYLYRFCENKGVYYYDLRAELADHLAEAIEQEMTADTSLTFDWALEKVYKRFGYGGLAKLAEKREKQAERQVRKIHNRYFFSYFKKHKLLYSLLLVLLLLILPQQFAGAIMLKQLYSALIPGVTAAGVLTALYLAYRFSHPQKSLLLLKGAWGSLNHYWTWTPIMWTLNTIKPDFVAGNEIILYLGFSILMLVQIISLLSGVEMCRDLHKKARKNYPLAFEN